MTRWLLPCAVALAICCSAVLGAHTVPEEPIVAVTLRPDGERLHVRVLVPIAGLADAELPRNQARRLDRPAADDILRLVAREIANALSLAESQQALEPPAATVTVAPDESQVEFAFTYALRLPRAPLSARLHTFPAAPRPLSMVATFEPAGEHPRTFTVSGAPERVLFEPGVPAVARYFAAHGGSILLDNVDALLMALCLAVGVVARADLRLSVAALAVGHVAGFVARAGALTPISAAPSQVAGALAASVVAAGAVALVVSARPLVFTVLAVLFGVLNGGALGDQLRGQASFAGAHQAVAVGTVATVTTIGQIWVVAVLATIVTLVRGRGVSDRLLRYGAAAWAGHSALHLIADRSFVPEGVDSRLLMRLETLILLSWLAAVVAVAAVRAVRGHTVSPRQS